MSDGAVQSWHVFADDALGDHDAVGLVEQIQAGAVSIGEVTDAAISRVERADAELGAVAFRAYDRARAEARDPRGGYFAGVPTFLKDNVDVAGIPTRDGSDAWTGRPARVDGDFAKMYGATGLINLGKTQLSEFGFLPTAEHERLGSVRNPWSREYTTGASSAGSAALVASGAVPLAHANDGGGSIRIPASACGLVGLKPTRGRLAQDKIMREMPVRIVSDGVLTRSVRDTAAFFREAEKIYRAHHLSPIGDLTRPGRNRLKIAVFTAAMGQQASPEVEELTRKTANLLEELGHTVVEGAVPDVDERFKDDFLLYWAFLGFVMVRQGRLMRGRSWDPSRLEPFTLGLAKHAGRNLHKLPGAIRRLRRSSLQSAQLYDQYDVLLAPTLATATPRLGELKATDDYQETLDRVLDWLAFTPMQNATGEPAISLPLAQTSGGLPLGMMFGAAAGREGVLLELAYELEEAVPFARIQG